MARSDQAVQRARTLLAGELQCDVDDVQVINVEAVEWSDSSVAHNLADNAQITVRLILPKKGR